MPEETWYDARPQKKVTVDIQRGLHDSLDQLDRYTVELEDVIDRKYKAGRARAKAESDWERHKAKVMMRIANSGDKMAADLREAKAMMTNDPRTGLMGEDLYTAFKMAEAEEKAVTVHSNALQSQMTSCQSQIKAIKEAAGLS